MASASTATRMALQVVRQALDRRRRLGQLGQRVGGLRPDGLVDRAQRLAQVVDGLARVRRASFAPRATTARVRCLQLATTFFRVGRCRGRLRVFRQVVRWSYGSRIQLLRDGARATSCRSSKPPGAVGRSRRRGAPVDVRGGRVLDEVEADTYNWPVSRLPLRSCARKPRRTIGSMRLRWSSCVMSSRPDLLMVGRRRG